jgi:GDP-4-dehydro-6-deoxy-D-mannose reductase
MRGSYMGRTESVLITGGAGMVGSHLAERLIRDGLMVVGTSFAPTVELQDLDPRVDWRSIDVRQADDVAALIDEVRPSIIYHLAAQSYPTVSWERPVETFDSNVIGTVHVFEAIKRLKHRHGYDPTVVVACSSAEYGASLANTVGPVSEDAPLQPLHPYGVSKVAQDLLAFQYWVNDRIRAIRVRIFNTTGPRKRQDVVSDFAARVARVLKEGGTLRVGNLETRRAILDVQDLIRALILVTHRGVFGEVYNVSGLNVYRIGDLLALFERQVDRSLKYTVDPALLRSSDEPLIHGDTSKLKTATNWHPIIPIEETIAAVLKYELARDLTPHRPSPPAFVGVVRANSGVQRPPVF